MRRLESRLDDSLQVNPHLPEEEAIKRGAAQGASKSRVIATSGEKAPVERVKWSRLLHARTWLATKKASSQPNRASAFGVARRRAKSRPPFALRERWQNNGKVIARLN